MNPKKRKKKPGFLIIGAQKCGTTWLHQQLATHPQIYLPKDKDDEFFSYLPLPPSDRYFDKFVESEEQQLIGDSCVSYLWSPHPLAPVPTNFNPDIPKTIADTLGTDCRLVILLKDPVIRTLSAYLHHIAHGTLSPDCPISEASDALGLIALSRYGWHLQHWLQYFPPEQLLVLPDPSSSDPNQLLLHVCHFLNIPCINFKEPERIVFGGPQRRLDESGLWLSLSSNYSFDIGAIQRPCLTKERGEQRELRLIHPAEIKQLEQFLRSDTEQFAAMAKRYLWHSATFQTWRTWPKVAKQ